MKRIMSLFLILISLTFMLPGCTGAGADKDAVIVAVKKVRTSQNDFIAQQECIDKYVENFKKANPGISVRIEYVNEKPADISDYDVLLIGADDLLYYTNGELENLSEYYDKNGINKSDIVESAVNLGKITGDDGIFYIPFNMDRAVVIADTAVFDERGVALPSYDWKFSDLSDIGSALVYNEKVDGESRRTVGIYMPMHMPCVWQYVLRACGTAWYDGEHILFEDKPETADPLVEVYELYKSGAAKGYNGKHANAAAAMSLCYVCDPGNNYIASETEEELELNPGSNYEALLEAGTFKVLPLPNGNDGKPCGTVNTDFVRGFCINKSSSKKDKAAKFAMYSLTDEGQKILNEFYGGIPVMKSLWSEDFWRRGTLTGENGDAALIGIEYDVRDDFSVILAGNPQLYDMNIKLNGLIGTFVMRDFSDSSQNEKALRKAFQNFAKYANRMFDGKDSTLS